MTLRKLSRNNQKHRTQAAANKMSINLEKLLLPLQWLVSKQFSFPAVIVWSPPNLGSGNLNMSFMFIMVILEPAQGFQWKIDHLLFSLTCFLFHLNGLILFLSIFPPSKAFQKRPNWTRRFPGICILQSSLMSMANPTAFIPKGLKKPYKSIEFPKENIQGRF